MEQDIKIDHSRLPQHIAIIMDGNGRWAKQRGLPRNAGHQQGVEAVKKITEYATRLGIKYLTVYTFSTENWNRPSDEVAALMSLVLDSLEEQIFMTNNVRFRMIGDADGLPEAVCRRIKQCEYNTRLNDRMTVTIAINYSARWEIAAAARAIVNKVQSGEIEAHAISEQTVSDNLTTHFMPDPDLMIRTGGELRLSNYLLWQCAYSELYFCDTYWPDFNEQELLKAIHSYQQRERRYGMTSEQIIQTDVSTQTQA